MTFRAPSAIQNAFKLANLRRKKPLQDVAWQLQLGTSSRGPKFDSSKAQSAIASGDPELQINVFMEALLNSGQNRRTELIDLYQAVKSSGDCSYLEQFLPVAPRFLSHLAYARDPQTQQQIIGICDDLLSLYNVAKPSCVCSAGPIQHNTCKSHGSSFHPNALKTRKDNPKECNMKNGKVSNILIHNYVQALARIHHPDTALATWKKYEQIIPRIVRGFAELPLGSIMSSFLEAGKPEKALQLFEQYRNKLNRSARIGTLVLRALVDQHQIDQAVNFLKELSPKALDVTHYNFMISSLIRSGNCHQATTLYNAICLRATENSQSGIEVQDSLCPDVYTHTAIMKGMLLQGNIKAAVELFRSRFKFTEETIQFSKQSSYPVMITQFSVYPPSDVTYCLLIFELCKADSKATPYFELALQLHLEMLECERIFSPVATLSLVEHAIRIKSSKAAKFAFTTLLDGGGVPDGKLIQRLESVDGISIEWLISEMQKWIVKNNDRLMDRRLTSSSRWSAHDKELMNNTKLLSLKLKEDPSFLFNLLVEKQWVPTSWRKHWDKEPGQRNLNFRKLRRNRLLRKKAAILFPTLVDGS
jgi:hypothetical protein